MHTYINKDVSIEMKRSRYINRCMCREKTWNKQLAILNVHTTHKIYSTSSWQTIMFNRDTALETTQISIIMDIELNVVKPAK